MMRQAGLTRSVSALALILGAGTSALAQDSAPEPWERALAMLDESPDRRPVERLMIIGSHVNRSKVAGSATYIGEEELETFKYQDIMRILRLAPGVNVQEEDGFGLRPNIGLRGTTVERSEQITLMEDGVLIAPSPYAAPAAYYFPTPGRLEGVEVTKGASAVRFGPRTVGGAINLVSRSVPEEAGGFADVRLGERDMWTVHAAAGGTFHVDAGLLQNVGILLETFQSESDGFKKLRTGERVGGFDVEDYMVKVKADTGDAASVFQSLQVKFGYTENDSGSSYLGLTDEDFKEDPFQRYAASAQDNIVTDHWQVQVNHYAEFSERFSLTTVAYYNDFERDWFKLDGLDFGEGRFSPVLLFQPVERFQETLSGLRGTDVSLAEAQAELERVLDVLRGDADSVDDALKLRHNARNHWSAGVQSIAALKFDTGAASHDLELSLRYHEDRESRLQNWENFKMENGTMVLTSVDPVGSESNRVAKARAWSLHARDEIGIGKWRFTPGVRAEIVDLDRIDFSRSDPDRSEGATGSRHNDVTAISPGLGVFYDVNEHLSLLAGIHRGVNPPGPSSDQASEEKSLNLEAGFLYDRNGFNLEIVGFYNNVDDMIGTCSASRGCVDADIGDQFNVGEAEVFGLEVQGSYDIPLGFGGLVIPLRANYTFTDAEFREAVDSPVFGAVTAGDAIPNIPKHQFTLRGGLEAETWSVIALANYTGKVRTEAGQGSIPSLFQLDSRTIIDLAANWQILENVNLFFEVKNLTDKEFGVARRPYGLRPGLPQTIVGGATFSF